MENDTRPAARPGAGEITPPEMTPQTGRGGVWDQTRVWMDELTSDPRMVRGGTRLLEVTLGDPKVRACLGQRLDAGTAAPLEVRPGGAMRRDRQAAEDLDGQLSCLEIDRITRELLHGIWFGHAIAECIWEIDGGRVRLADLRVRSPEVIRWDPITHEPLLLTRQTPAGQPLPPAKFVLLTAPRIHGEEPHGPGIGNWCFWPVWLKRFACSSWATALERFGTPIATATVRNRTGEEAQAEMREALTALAALASGASLVLPEGIEIDVLESGRRAGGDYEIFIRDMDRMIADAVIGQHGTAEIGPHVGTGEVHMKILERLVTADARRGRAASAPRNRPARGPQGALGARSQYRARLRHAPDAGLHRGRLWRIMGGCAPSGHAARIRTARPGRAIRGHGRAGLADAPLVGEPDEADGDG